MIITVISPCASLCCVCVFVGGGGGSDMTPELLDTLVEADTHPTQQRAENDVVEDEIPEEDALASKCGYQ